MTLHLPVDSETEARLSRLAREAGKDLTAYVAEIVERAAVADIGNRADSAADFERTLDEVFAADTRELPAVSLTYSRQDIYSDHD